MLPISKKNEVLKLRQAGYSYSYISLKTGIGKGTLSAWLGQVPYTPNKETIFSIGKARAASGEKKAQIKRQSIEEAKREAIKDIGVITRRDLFMLGVGLYMGEGAKTCDITRITNSDPKVLKLMMHWFLSLGVPKENFIIKLHLYPDTDIKKSLQFWSSTTTLPRSQFRKTYIDIRTNKKARNRGKLPYGTAHLGVNGLGNKKLGKFFARKIQAWQDEVVKQCGCGLPV
ncbi:MAG TPA: hypothetical protein VMR46_02365 [Candidatus Paceibacterota bacterium]|nr:hypothetical protein [Candidatus Paceibacterota bacterium]